MRKLFIALAALIAGFTATAQKKQDTAYSKFILSVNGGLSIPMGSFSKADYADEKSGFTKTGSHFDITGTYYLNKHFGIGAFVGYSRFGIKGSQSLADGYKEDSGTDSTTLYHKGSNHSFSILVGPYYQVVSCKKLSVNVHVLGGYTNTHLAGFQVFYEDYTDNSMTQREASGGAFGLQAGVGVQYHLTGRLGVQINGDYFVSKPNIGISYDDFIVNSGRKLSSYNESLYGINATIGITYSLF